MNVIHDLFDAYNHSRYRSIGMGPSSMSKQTTRDRDKRPQPNLPIVVPKIARRV